MMKNSLYKWHGINREGESITGHLEAINPELAKRQLLQQGIYPRSISKKISLNNPLSSKRISNAEITAFSRQFSTMVNAGLSLTQSLNIIIKSSDNSRLVNLLRDINQHISAGYKLTEGFKRHPNYFNDLFCSLINVGEESGCLGEMLNRIALYREKSDSLRKKIKKALLYPSMIIIFSFLVTLVLLLKVIPQFQTLFTSFNATLPTYTLLVLDFSQAVRTHGWYLLGSFILFIFFFIVAKRRSKKIHYAVDTFVLHTPIFGKLLRKAIMARFSRTLATSFSSGMPIIEALTIVEKVAGNRVYQAKIAEIRDSVIAGNPLSSSIENTKLFPNAMVQMVASGEETGETDQMLNKFAVICEEDVDNIVDGLSNLVEPLIIIIIGALVGGLVIAMYLPIFKLGSIV